MKSNELVALYIDNFPKDHPLRPTGDQLGGQIKRLIEVDKVPLHALERLIPIVAREGQPLSVGTLMIANKRGPSQKPTPTPQNYSPVEVEEQAAKAVPMPENVRALRTAIRYRGEIPKIEGSDDL
jgi:hypothetical protein